VPHLREDEIRFGIMASTVRHVVEDDKNVRTVVVGLNQPARV